MVIWVMALSPLNALSPISTTFFPMDNSLSEDQFSKAFVPMEITLSGITRLSCSLIPEKALPPTIVSSVGNTIESKFGHPEKALSPIVLTLSGISTRLKAEHPLNTEELMAFTF